MMNYQSVVVAQNDKRVAEKIAGCLNRIFPSVRIVDTLPELEAVIPRFRADLFVLDLEMTDLSVVQRLCREYHVPVICTHRVPDERMWAESLNAGAIDCCQNTDVRSLELTLTRSLHATSVAA
jgi:DNA-binding NtrC family response regulator